MYSLRHHRQEPGLFPFQDENLQEPELSDNANEAMRTIPQKTQITL